jgi:mono/diheme cytochrome c family protein
MWITAHVGDPASIAPKPAADVDPQPGRAVAAWARAVRSHVPPPAVDPTHAEALAVIGARCLGCHKLDGQGHGESPNLSRAGRDRDAAWLAGWVADPLAYEYDTDMPGFANVLSKDEIAKVASYLATRR